jgi:putative glycosyltransferase
MKLSVVATLYRSQEYIDAFCDRAAAAARAAGLEHEIVLVNDGSPDDSVRVARAAQARHPQLRIVDLSRNFGHHKAMMAGLAEARGELVFLIDSDLEEEPEWLGPFLAEMRNTGSDVVYGVQKQRRGGWFDRLAGHAYYAMLRAASGLDIPPNHVTARLMTRRYVDALLRFGEREVDLTGLWVITGYDQRPWPVTKHSTSRSTYTLARKVGFLVDSLASFSSLPLVAIFWFGVFVSAGAGLYAAYLVINRLFLSTPLDGWTSVMASIWLLGGLIISFLGVIGIYLAKVFSEAKQRPNTIVRAVYRPEDN